MLFLRRLSDAFDEAHETVVEYYRSKGKSEEEAQELADDEDEYTQTFFITERARWQNLQNLKHDSQL